MALGNINQEGFVFSVIESDLFSILLNLVCGLTGNKVAGHQRPGATPSWSIHQPHVPGLSALHQVWAP